MAVLCCLTMNRTWDLQVVFSGESFTLDMLNTGFCGSFKDSHRLVWGGFFFSLVWKQFILVSSQAVHPLQVALKEIKPSRMSRKCFDFQWSPAGMNLKPQSVPWLFFFSYSDSPNEKEVEVSLNCWYPEVFQLTDLVDKLNISSYIEE